MSGYENRSVSPVNGVGDTQDNYQHTYQDPRKSVTGSGSPAPRTSQTSPQTRASTTLKESAHDTATSLPNQASRQPINDAVTSAVHTTDSSVSPELIQLITQNVIQQLNVHKVAAPITTLPVQPPSNVSSNVPDTTPPPHGSPSLDRATVYTPPSPHRAEDGLANTACSPTMPVGSSINASGYATRRRDVSPFSRTSNEEAILSDAESRSSRPEAPRRSSTDHGATVLEKYWGKLFDAEGQSTERLRRFLEGLALRLIEDYEPKNSLVITPNKMQRFYEDTKLDERPEIYPWKLIFDDKTSSISRLLRERDIRVEHHLIQAAPDARPDIPGLTPHGFASWMTMMIKAHPDYEYERLAKVLKIMAVNHPQDQASRFPAAMSRRLFPATGDANISDKLSVLLAAHCKVQISSRQSSTVVPPNAEQPHSPRKGDMPPAPTVEDALDESHKAQYSNNQGPKDSGVSFMATESVTSRPRNMSSIDPEPSKAHSVTSIEDESDAPTRQPLIERQRQPYVSQPGGGKTHDMTSSGDEATEHPQTQMPDSNYVRRTKSVSNSQKPRVPPPIAIHQRPEAQVSQPDGGELSRSRSNVAGGLASGSMHRTRSNSTHDVDARSSRRQRSNSTYANDGGKKVYPQRSPSFSRGGPDLQSPRATDSSLNYSTYATSSDRPTSTYRPITVRYEYGRLPTLDVRDPRYEREKSRDRNHDARSRPRFQSTGGQDYPSPDDFYRSQQIYANGNASANGVVQSPAGTYGYGAPYPPTAYRDGAR